MFYLLAPMVGLYGLVLALPCAVFVAGAWGLMRRSLLKWERPNLPNRSPWSVRRTLLVVGAALLVLFELLDVGPGRFGSRWIALLARAIGASSMGMDWLQLARAGFSAVAGACGFYWALSRVSSFPPFIRAALFGPRVLVTVGLSVWFSVLARHTMDLGDVLRMIPDAVALVGCWSYLHACWESRRTLSQSLSASGLVEGRALPAP
jgi:hypothetical protein